MDLVPVALEQRRVAARAQGRIGCAVAHIAGMDMAQPLARCNAPQGITRFCLHRLACCAQARILRRSDRFLSSSSSYLLLVCFEAAMTPIDWKSFLRADRVFLRLVALNASVFAAAPAAAQTEPLNHQQALLVLEHADSACSLEALSRLVDLGNAADADAALKDIESGCICVFRMPNR